MFLGSISSVSSSLDLNLDDLSSEFKSYVNNKLKLDISELYAFKDPSSGDIVLGFTDTGGDSLNVIFTIDQYGSPGCSLLDSNDDEVGWMQLDGIVPTKDNMIDVSSWTWLRKSVLVNLFNIGNINYVNLISSSQSDSLGESLSEAFSMRGKKRISIVAHIERTRKLSDYHLLLLGAARRHYIISKINSINGIN